LPFRAIGRSVPIPCSGYSIGDDLGPRDPVWETGSQCQKQGCIAGRQSDSEGEPPHLSGGWGYAPDPKSYGLRILTSLVGVFLLALKLKMT